MRLKMKIDLDWYEYTLWVIYVIIGYVFVYFYKVFSMNETHKNFLISGYFIKVIGGLFFSLIYVYVYKGGDTIEYYLGTKELVSIFYENPNLYFKILLSSNDEINNLLNLSNYYIRFENASDARFMLKISSFFNILGFNTYLGMTFFFSVLSFLSAIIYSEIMLKIMPHKEKLIFRINYFVPSVLFWGSGILKDTWTFVCFSILCFILIKLVEDRKKILKYIFLSILPILIIFKLKAYILICFIPWIFTSIFLKLINKTQNPVAKFLFFPYILIFVVISGTSILNFILESSNKYNKDIIINKVQGFHTWHKALGGSVYDLGQIDYTQIGLISKFPAAVNVTLFRPYPWEIKSFMTFFISVESFFLMIMSIYLILLLRLNIFRYLLTNSYLFGALIFIVIFAFFIGLTSYNFGALTRFKLPLMPFFVFIIFYLLQKKKSLKNN
jgi:hypothetical protein